MVGGQSVQLRLPAGSGHDRDRAPRSCAAGSRWHPFTPAGAPAAPAAPDQPDRRRWRRCAMYGRAALIPAAIGSYPSVSMSGFSHTTPAARRCSSRMASRRTSGSPTSRPSLTIITTLSRPTMRSPYRCRKSRRQVPMLVPPAQACGSRPSRRRSPAAAPSHLVGHALEPRREGEHLDPQRRTWPAPPRSAVRSVCSRSSSGCRRPAVPGAACVAGGAATVATAPRRRSAGRPATSAESRTAVPCAAGRQRRDRPSCSRRTKMRAASLHRCSRRGSSGASGLSASSGL